MRIRERDADPSCGLCRFRGGDAVESFHASAADFADFTGRRCGSLGCGLCKILRGLCNLPGADHPGGHAELQQPVPTTDANRSIQHSRLRHAGMPPVRPARGLASRAYAILGPSFKAFHQPAGFDLNPPRHCTGKDSPSIQSASLHACGRGVHPWIKAFRFFQRGHPRRQMGKFWS